MLAIAIEALIKIGLIIGILMTAAAYLVLAERWIAAWIQDRIGPNRVGIPLTNIKMFGLGQPAADGVKFLFKAQYTPAHVDKALYFLAPITIFCTALAAFAFIPFGHVLPTDILPASWGFTDALGHAIPIQLVVAPKIDAGMIFIFAMGSISVYGVVLGGWASNNKYSFLGGLRSSAQLIAYELPMGLGILGVVLAAGSLRLDDIIMQQAQSGVWNIFLQPLGFIVFAIASCAEASRMPFDLPECESELIGGYHTEYFGVKLLMYLVGEYLHMVAASMLIVILFLGGWHLWGITGSGEHATLIEAILRILVLNGKALAVILFFMVVRWSWSRFRFDQLMSLAWLTMLPVGMVNVAFVAIWEEYGSRWAADHGLPPALVMCVVGTGVMLLSWFVASTMSTNMVDNLPRRGPVAPSFAADELA
jgi:NADH-quinone oxidoreductase subunit H